MKKTISLIMALLIMTSFAACKGKTTAENDSVPKSDGSVEEIVADSASSDGKLQDETITDDEPVADTNAPAAPNASKPSANTQTPASPSDSPAAPETSKPEQTTPPVQEQKPSSAPVASTLGQTLLADFKAKASAGMNTLAIAEALVTNPAIKFSGAAMPIEEGYLSGFDNTEIKGFKSGAMFAPMIGSIAFVGYVFELESAADAPAFKAKLEKSANLIWNICVEAEEMVSGVSGNKVFFVMCPKSLEE